MAPKNRFLTEYKENFKEFQANNALRLPQDNKDKIVESPLKSDTYRLRESENKDALKKSSSSTKENHALRYKARLAPTMPAQNRIRYLSEYQKEFEWKKPVDREAPILSAEKMIYGGEDGNPSRTTRINIPKKTEYQLQFVKHPIMTSPERNVGEGNAQPTYTPLGYQDKQVAAGKPYKKQPPPVVAKKSMVFQSEYHANFKSPSKYDYVKGSWVGADPPQFHPPDEVLELREKVQNYRSRAREGSFLSLLQDLQKYGKVNNQDEKSNENSGPKPPTSKGENLAGSPHTNASRKSTPVKAAHLKDEDGLNDQTCADHQTGGKKDEPVLVPIANSQAEGQVLGHDKLLWDKDKGLPGPPINKAHSLDSVSHETMIASAIEENNRDQPKHGGKQHAWTVKRFGNHPHVVPPYYTAESNDSLSDTTISDVTISEIESYTYDQEKLSNQRKQATKKLFTGKRDDFVDDNERNGANIISRIPSNVSNLKPAQITKPENFQKTISKDRKQLANGIDSDEMSCVGDNISCNSRGSFISQSDSILSVEAMEKRREIASETLQRAKRRQAQL